MGKSRLHTYQKISKKKLSNNLSSTGKTGLVLAAGYGSRLKGVSAVTSFKPLTPILGEPLICRTISSLEKANCSKIVLVLGYGYEEIKKELENTYKGKTPIEFIYNEKYELSNGVSVLSAKNSLSDIFVMTMADHILGDSLMEIAGKFDPPKDSAALLVDYKLNTIFDMDDATKVLSQHGKIKSIGKKILNYNCIDTGVFVCSSALIHAMQAFYDKHGDVSISDGVQHLSNQGNMLTIDIGDGYWQDVDTPEMFSHVEQILKNKSNKPI